MPTVVTCLVSVLRLRRARTLSTEARNLPDLVAFTTLAPDSKQTGLGTSALSFPRCVTPGPFLGFSVRRGQNSIW